MRKLQCSSDELEMDLSERIGPEFSLRGSHYFHLLYIDITHSSEREITAEESFPEKG